MNSISRRAALALAGATTAVLAAAAPVAAAEPAPMFTTAIGAEHLSSSDAWTPVLAAQPGERLRVLISYMNTSAAIEHNPVVRIKLPKGALLNGSVTLTNGMHTAGMHVSGPSLIGRGLNIGTYGSGADGYLEFFIRMPALKYVHCGITLLTIPVEMRVGAGHHGATLHLHAHNDCPVSTTVVPMPTS